MYGKGDEGACPGRWQQTGSLAARTTTEMMVSSVYSLICLVSVPCSCPAAFPLSSSCPGNNGAGRSMGSVDQGDKQHAVAVGSVYVRYGWYGCMESTDYTAVRMARMIAGREARVEEGWPSYRPST